MKLLAAALLALTSGTAAPVGKVASDPHPKTVVVTTSSMVVERPPVTEPPVTEAPATTVPPRDLLAECHATVARLLPLFPPPATWADPQCHEPDLAVEAEFGRPLQGYALWRQRTIHLTPQSQNIDLEYLYKHEVGHAWCFMTPWDAGSWESDVYRYSEECANSWAAERAS